MQLSDPAQIENERGGHSDAPDVDEFTHEGVDVVEDAAERIEEFQDRASDLPVEGEVQAEKKCEKHERKEEVSRVEKKGKKVPREKLKDHRAEFGFTHRKVLFDQDRDSSWR